MGIAHPALTTTGRRKGKKKFASAAAAAAHRELQAEWERKQAQWAAMSVTGAPRTTKPRSGVVTTPVVSAPTVRETVKVGSLGSWVTGAVSSKPTQQYTGDKMLGITVMHKSCLQPVFNAEAAQDAAKMRRG